MWWSTFPIGWRIMASKTIGDMTIVASVLQDGPATLRASQVERQKKKKKSPECSNEMAVDITKRYGTRKKLDYPKMHDVELVLYVMLNRQCTARLHNIFPVFCSRTAHYSLIARSSDPQVSSVPNPSFLETRDSSWAAWPRQVLLFYAMLLISIRFEYPLYF